MQIPPTFRVLFR